eukprot:m.532200 g.532200  ORF g.532200 m.532200 type:complete len:154 (-) comp57592_c0_seq19:1388-1849(-)
MSTASVLRQPGGGSCAVLVSRGRWGWRALLPGLHPTIEGEWRIVARRALLEQFGLAFLAYACFHSLLGSVVASLSWRRRCVRERLRSVASHWPELTAPSKVSRPCRRRVGRTITSLAALSHALMNLSRALKRLPSFVFPTEPSLATNQMTPLD